MPSGVFLKRINLDLLYPPFLERYLTLKARCLARGSKYLCTYGHRTFEESSALYKAHMNGGPKAAPAGLSAHNYGLAGDEALIIQETPKRVCRWGSKDFDILGEECARLGLVWGGKFNDKPHVNWPGFVSGAQLQPLLKIWTSNPKLPLPERLRKVWDYVDQHGPKLDPVPNA